MRWPRSSGSGRRATRYDRARRAVAVLLAGLCLGGVRLASASFRREVTVTLADGRSFENVTLGPVGRTEQVGLQRAGQPVVGVTAADLVSIVMKPGGSVNRDKPPTLRLANGDLLRGKVTFLPDRKLAVQTEWAKLIVPLDWIAALQVQPEAALPEPAVNDAVVLLTDRIEGEIREVTPEQVVIRVVGQPVPLKMEQIQSLVFGARPSLQDTREGTVVRMLLNTGERLTARWARYMPEGRPVLTVALPWGAEQQIPFDRLTRLEVRNGTLAYVSELSPTEVKESTLLAPPSRFKVDRAVSGLPLRLQGKTYAHGLGVHSRSDLTFALDGSYRTFSAVIGVDDSVAVAGSVIFRVYGDGKLLYESPVLRASGDPLPIKVDLAGALLLRLSVDPADGGDVGDHADWADARLLRQ